MESTEKTKDSDFIKVTFNGGVELDLKSWVKSSNFKETLNEFKDIVTS